MIRKTNKNIGVFDSGLGGLAILKEFIKELPEYNYVYLGDNARVPYGGRSPHLIYQFTSRAVEFLAKQNCSLIILACNTSTAISLKKIQQELIPKKYPQLKVLGIIKPIVEKVATLNPKKIGVVGTYATVKSESFVREIGKVLPKTTVVQKACPLFVSLIEEGEINKSGLNYFLKKYLTLFKREKIEELILGCTHYGLIETEIKKFLGNKTRVLSEGRIAASKLREYLQKHKEVEGVLGKNKKRTFCVTDLHDRYQKLFHFFLGNHFKNGNKLELVNL